MTVIERYFKDEKDEYEAVCGVCGWPLTKHYIAADFSGQCVDYTEKRTGQVSFCMCSECFLKMKEYCEGGPEAAYRRLNIACSITEKSRSTNEHI